MDGEEDPPPKRARKERGGRKNRPSQVRAQLKWTHGIVLPPATGQGHLPPAMRTGAWAVGPPTPAPASASSASSDAPKPSSAPSSSAELGWPMLAHDAGDFNMPESSVQRKLWSSVTWNNDTQECELPDEPGGEIQLPPNCLEVGILWAGPVL